jgi:NADPH-dependent curcumin reductase
VNRQVILTSRPEGIAQSENFMVTESDPKPILDGQIRIRNKFLSVEPAMRGWIADVGNYSEPVAIGSVMRSLAVGQVSETRVDDYQEGDWLVGWFGWQDEAVVEQDAIVRRIIEQDLSPSLALGILGINGVTAHLALTKIGEPRPGDTVLVSTASGAVGSAVGQIAKIMGCTTIGIAGGMEKVTQCIESFGYNHALDYKAVGLGEAISASCPDGIDIYFDNVAGQISDAVYPYLALNARVVVCGTASIPSWSPWPQGPRVERHLLVKRARLQGFVIFDHMADYESSVTQLAEWVRSGELQYAEDILEGIEACPDALAGLYRGENKGKRIIKL